MHWRAYSVGSTGELLGGIHWRAGHLAGSTGELLRATLLSKTLGGEPPRRDSAGSTSRYSAGSTGEQLWRDTQRLHWRAALARHSAGSTGKPLWRNTGEPLGRDTWRDPLAGHWAGSTGEQLWWDTRRDPLASRSYARSMMMEKAMIQLGVHFN